MDNKKKKLTDEQIDEILERPMEMFIKTDPDLAESFASVIRTRQRNFVLSLELRMDIGEKITFTQKEIDTQRAKIENDLLYKYHNQLNQHPYEAADIMAYNWENQNQVSTEFFGDKQEQGSAAVQALLNHVFSEKREKSKDEITSLLKELKEQGIESTALSTVLRSEYKNYQHRLFCLSFYFHYEKEYLKFLFSTLNELRNGKKDIENYFAEFEKIANETFESFKRKYYEIINAARDWQSAHDLFGDTILRPAQKESGNRLMQLGTVSNFSYEWDRVFKLDKSKGRAEIFNEMIGAIAPDKRDESVKLLGEQEGFNLLWSFWVRESGNRDLKEYISDNFDEEIEPGEKETGTNKEFTTARQVLAVYYLLDELKVFEKVAKIEVANFIQFLTGKETGVKKINDTTIYKKVKKPFPNNDKQLEKDLQFVRNHFEKLNLQGIVDRINKEIGSKEQK